MSRRRQTQILTFKCWCQTFYIFYVFFKLNVLRLLQNEQTWYRYFLWKKRWSSRSVVPVVLKRTITTGRIPSYLLLRKTRSNVDKWGLSSQGENFLNWWSLLFSFLILFFVFFFCEKTKRQHHEGLTRNGEEPRVSFWRFAFVMTVSMWWCCAHKKWSWGDNVMFALMYRVRVFIQNFTIWRWTKSSVRGSYLSTSLIILRQFWDTCFDVVVCD